MCACARMYACICMRVKQVGEPLFISLQVSWFCRRAHGVFAANKHIVMFETFYHTMTGGSAS